MSLQKKSHLLIAATRTCEFRDVPETVQRGNLAHRTAACL